MKPAVLVIGAVIFAALAIVPLVATGYQLALAISILYFTILATSWALFSGPSHYISLATAAFFGIGAYTVAVLSETLPYPLILVVAALIGVAVAFVVGLSTLRLSGIYFVIFTFGLSELIRQSVAWYEVNIAGSVGRYIFLKVTQADIYWQLLALAALVFVTGSLIFRSRLGLALRVVGEDEIVARHTGIDATRAKLAVFAISSGFASLTGAIMAPRWTYLDPNIAFNPVMSFEVVIMALLGGAGTLLGPLLGAAPLVLLFDALGAYFPSSFSIILGLIFVVIVYFLPQGVAGLLMHYAPWLAPGAGGLSTLGEKIFNPVWPKAAARPQPQPVALAVTDLRKAFGGLVAVAGMQFKIARGQIVGLIGPNGSGKTTVLNLISGALKPDAGDIRLYGEPIAQQRVDRIAQLGVARTFQLVRILPPLTSMENVLPGFAFRSPPVLGDDAEREARVLLERVGLADKAGVPAGDLTYIDQKRLELARALALNPTLLLLDEWLAGLNPSELNQGIALVKSLRGDGITIILVEHVMDAIRSLCDHCVVMNAGRKIAEGTPTQVLADPEVVRAYIGDADA